MRWSLLSCALVFAPACSSGVDALVSDAASPSPIEPRVGDDGGLTDVALASEAGDATDASIVDGSLTDVSAPEAGPSEAAPPCDPTGLPADNPCVITDTAAVFVSSSRGATSAAGTQAAPLKSINEGLTLARGMGKRLYVCAESFTEQVVLADGVSMFGYFDCSQTKWKTSSSKALVTSTSPSGVRVNSIVKATRVEGFTFVSPSAPDPSGSSFGMIVDASPGLSLVRVTVRAGDGAAGNAGANAPAVSSGNGSGGNYWAWRTCSATDFICMGRSGSAGTAGCMVGGATAPAWQQGLSGGLGASSTKLTCAFNSNFEFKCSKLETSRSGGSGTRMGTGGTVNTPAGNGPDGELGAHGVSGASVGTFSAAGYVAASGTPGVAGQPGGGGGGGGPSDSAGGPNPGTYYSDSGAGGGAGGCAGGAGTAGGGGGASVAIALFNSPITLESTELFAGHGGNGAAGGLGTAGTSGSPGGTGWAGNLGAGGAGGSGGSGGNGGSGGGGPSIALVVKGTAPKQTSVTLVPGTAGAGGGSTNAGLSVALHALQ